MGSAYSKQGSQNFYPSPSSLLAEDWTAHFNLPAKRITRCPLCFHQRTCKGYWCQNCESRRFRELFSSWGLFGSMWKRKGSCKVALKMLDGFKESSVEYLNELRAHYKCISSGSVLTCYGITQDETTNNYMLVMDYAKQGDLTHFLRHNMVNYDWYRRVRELWYIARGLKAIHDADLVHKDLHSGNILFNTFTRRPAIGDLGLCRPVKESSSGNVVLGVLPYVAPEILRGNAYTKASDIYSFSMIMWEVSTLKKPFSNVAHDASLALEVTLGMRPAIAPGTPKKYAELMKLCWDVDPVKRPSAEELVKKLEELMNDRNINSSTPKIDIEEMPTHPEACFTSRILEFPHLEDTKYEFKEVDLQSQERLHI
ncbi:14871_t:CDS:2, partial [Acaulospora morrowiae]